MATIDVQVGAEADDGFVWSYSTEGSGGILAETNTWIQFGNLTDTDKRSLWVRFTGVTITAGATIDVAYLTYTAYVSRTETVVRSIIYGNDTATPAAPTTVAGYWALVKATASAAWDNVGAWTVDVGYNSPSIVPIIQELVDSYAYSNAAMQFMHWNNGSDVGGRRTPYGYSGTGTPAKLHIEYTAGGVTFVPRLMIV